VIVPGLAGSGLFASIEKAVLPKCSKSKTFSRSRQRLWLSLSELYYNECLFDVLEMVYSNSTGFYENKQGVSIEADDFGGLHGISHLGYLVRETIPVVGEFAQMISALKAAGHKERETLFGIPYDWRLAPQQIDWSSVKRLSEEAVRKNGGEKIVWVAHSLGNIMSSYFFNAVVDAEWKEKHIDSFLSIAGPYGGTPTQHKAYLSGYNDFFKLTDKIALVKPLVVRKLQRTSGASFTLLPREELWGDAATFIVNEGGDDRGPSVYSSGNWTGALEEGLRGEVEKGVQLMGDSLWRDPLLPTVCVWGQMEGNKGDVPVAYEYASADYDKEPKITRTEAGDGTVAVRSARQCSEWKHSALSLELPKKHLDLIMTTQVIQIAVDLSTGDLETVVERESENRKRRKSFKQMKKEEEARTTNLRLRRSGSPVFRNETEGEIDGVSVVDETKLTQMWNMYVEVAESHPGASREEIDSIFEQRVTAKEEEQKQLQRESLRVEETLAIA